MRNLRGFRLVLSIALVLCVRAAFAEQLPLKIYTTADGLASDRIQCLVSDSHGYLWIGTSDGLSRFDGYSFTSLTTGDGLPGASVQALLEARDGTYWAATNAGIVYWDPARERTPRLEVIHVAVGLPADDVRALLEDRSGRLWAGTHDGLYRLEKSGNAWRLGRSRLEPAERPLSSTVNVLHEDVAGNLWVGTEGGLFWLRPDGTTERVGGRDGPPQIIRSLLEERAGSIWAGSQGEGLFELRRTGRSGEVTVRHAFTRENGLAGSHVASLFETSDGKIWAGCFGGLTEISPERSSVRSYTTAEGISGTGIWALAEDRNGNLWLGSENGGIMRLARNGFRKYDARDGLASTRVASLFENRDGQPCAFTRGTRSEEISVDVSFLECFDGRRFHSVRPRLLPGTSFGWGWSQVMLQDAHGEWWIPTIHGLYRFPAVSFERLATATPRRIYTERDGLPSNALFRLFQDSRGNLWLGSVTRNPGVALWDRATDSFRSFSEKDGTPPEEPMAFAEDGTGAIWIGFKSSLARFRNGTMRLFREADGLPAGGVQALHRDREGRLWIGSGAGGIARVDRPEEEMPRFVRYGVGQGLSSQNVFSLTEDRWERIYIGTARGLDRLDPRRGPVQHFTEDDGLERGVIETSFCDRQGNLWFGSAAGLSRLQPAADVPRRPPPIRITRVFADGIRQPLPDLGVSEVRLPDLGPGSAPVQVDFLSIDFASGGRPRYQYLLEGTDRDWSAPTEERSVVYGLLPAGRHRFRVRVVANDGSIGQTPAEVRFTILAPLWRRPEFLALFAAVAVAIAYSLHRQRLKSALAVERIRMRVATDLHDDVGAGLSEIAILSELARRQQGGAPSTAVLGEIGDGARRLVDSMSDIVWSTDPRKDDVSSLAQRIRHFAGNVLESQGIRWSVEVSPQIERRPLDPETRRQILLIVKEALTNIARHAGCTRASVRMTEEPQGVAIEIEDDGGGLGSSTVELPGGAGLANMRMRAESLRGEFELHSMPAGGTRILVRVPLRRRGSGGLSAW